jgi:hypothetical protein
VPTSVTGGSPDHRGALCPEAATSPNSPALTRAPAATPLRTRVRSGSTGHGAPSPAGEAGLLLTHSTATAVTTGEPA